MKKIILIAALLAALPAMAQQGDTTIQIKVAGKCDMCKDRIEKAAQHRGVRSAKWDQQTQMLTLAYDPRQVSSARIQKAIANAGHDTELALANDDDYEKLPPCCHYRDTQDEPASGDARSIEPVRGVIMQEDEKGNLKPLRDATVMVAGSRKGITTVDNGYFSLTVDSAGGIITVSYVGFEPRSIDVAPGDHLTIALSLARPMDGIKVVAIRKATFVSGLSTMRQQVMTEKELFKAACCNLSESFETNPSVDVSFNDAVTGSKQIQMLGLSGNYTQLTVENLPGPRGIFTPWGLNSIPGAWVESIQLSKGVGSVANGFESIAGQVNTELKKPQTADRLFANVYVNNMGKSDWNLDLSQKIGKKWSTGLLLHDAYFNNRGVDFNHDGFRDIPTGNLFTVLNRWQFDNQRGWMGQFGFRFLTDSKTGGSTEFDPGRDKFGTTYYGLGIDTRRYEGFAKLGYVFPQKKYKSFGLQVSGFHHAQDSYFGTTVYDAKQDNIYLNGIYQSIIGNSNHRFRTGVSFVADHYDEMLRGTRYQRQENVAGLFFEYTFTHGDKFSLVMGARGDYNNLYGFFATPRLHARYAPFRGTTIRIAAGRGQRTANIFAENSSVFVSARAINLPVAAGSKAYGLNPETAWNEGISIDQKFRLFGRNASLALDFFRTDFTNQVVVDLDRTARAVDFYDLDGSSRSNSFQAEVQLEPLHKLELRLAYRMYDVKTTYHGQLLQRPLLARDRGFLNLAYEFRKWKFDYTLTYNGTKRIPNTTDNPVAYRQSDRSPAYWLMNAQVSRSIGKKRPVEVYAGGENLSNYFQDRVILGADAPFGPYFDASLVWGPVSGRMFYGGLRFRIK